jgi:hypothetical protein
MEAEPKALMYLPSQLSRLAGDVVTRLLDAVDDLSREFIGALGAALFGHESLEAVLGKLMLQVIKVAPGKAKGFGRLGYGVSLSLNAPEHFILHLEGVIRIKKGIGLEQRVLNLLRGSDARCQTPPGVCVYDSRGMTPLSIGLSELL